MLAEWRGDHIAGAGLRAALVVLTVAAGIAIAIFTLPLAESWRQF